MSNAHTYPTERQLALLRTLFTGGDIALAREVLEGHHEVAVAAGEEAEREAVVAFLRGARLDELADAVADGEHRREETL